MNNAVRSKQKDTRCLVIIRLLGLMWLAAMAAGCTSYNQSVDANDERDSEDAMAVFSEGVVEIYQGDSTTINIGTFGVPGLVVTGYTIDMPESVSRISISTDPTSDCPSGTINLNYFNDPTGYTTGNCQDWDIAPAIDAVPGEYRVTVRPTGASVPSRIVRAFVVIRVLASPGNTGASAAKSVSGRNGAWSVITRDQKRWAWGDNANGGPGVGSYHPPELPDDHQVDLGWTPSMQPASVYAAAPGLATDVTDASWQAVITNRNVGLGLASDGRVFSWGHRRNVTLGYEAIADDTPDEESIMFRPTPIETLVAGTAIDLAHNTGFAIVDGQIRSWGDFNIMSGVEPEATLPSTPAPETTPPEFAFRTVTNLQNATSVSAGNDHVLARLQDGTVWSWGSNADGQLGVGPVEEDKQATPVRVSLPGAATQIVATDAYSMALVAGRVWAWGSDTVEGSLDRNAYPTAKSGLASVSPISMLAATLGECAVDICKRTTAFALDSNQQVWRWGFNETGLDATPVLIASLDNVISIGSGMAITGDCSDGGFVWDLRHAPASSPKLIPQFGRSDPTCPSRLFIHVEGQGSVDVPARLLGCTDYCWVDVSDYDTVALIPTADPGWTFAGWEGTDECRDSDGSVQIHGAVQCVAIFVEDVTYTLRVDITSNTGERRGSVISDPLGIDCRSDCEAIFTNSTNITLTAEADDNWQFAGWARDSACLEGANAEITQFRITEDTHCSALFEPFPVETAVLTVTKLGTGSGTITSDVAGIDCGSDCNEDTPLGTHFVLTATADAGSVYAGWSGDGNCGDPDFVDDAQRKVSLTVNAPMTCTATFNTAAGGDFVVTVNNTGTGHGRVTSTPAGIDACIFQGPTSIPDGCNTFDFGSAPSVILTAEAIDGAFFEGWQGCDRTVVGTGGADDCEIDAGGSRTVEALFVAF